ncbi:reverse transcriptase domain-containing protein [Tanacetum coccineum]
MLQRCKDAHLVLNWEKCHFMVKEGIVLGHKVSSAGLEVDKAKIDVISKLPPPTNIKGIRSFLGHAGFYRRFIKDFSKIARPLTKLLEKDTPFEFDDECQKAFELLKEKLTCAPVIVSPNWNLPFELMCDANDFTVGTVLADHLSRIKNDETNDDSEVDDNFLRETLMEINTKDEPWFADFENYLVSDIIPKGMTDQHKNKFFSDLKHYFWEEPYLFKVYFNGMIRRCISGPESRTILDQCHHKLIGGHYGPNITAKKVLNLGFYWPTIIKEAHTLVRLCEACQKTGNISKRDEMPLNNIQVCEIFDIWGIDFMGPFPKSYKFEYILVAVDYVSKWAEAQALPTNDARVVVAFLKKLFCHFGMPKALISDRGTHFCNKIMERTMKRYGVNHRFSTSYHPQTSGQVENTNRALKRILEKTVKDNPAIWSRKLDDALWAFCTAYKTSGLNSYLFLICFCNYYEQTYRVGARANDLHMLKTLLYALCKLRGTAITDHLSMVPIDMEPQPIILAYIDLNLQTLAVARMLTPTRPTGQTQWGDSMANNPMPAAHSLGAQLKVMSTPIISILSDSSEESVADPIVTPEDSLPPAPDLPLVSPFLCSDDTEADGESEPAEQRPVSSSHDTLAPLSEFPLAPVVAPPGIQRKRVRPIPARRLSWRRVSHHSSDHHSSPDSSSSSAPFRSFPYPDIHHRHPPDAKSRRDVSSILLLLQSPTYVFNVDIPTTALLITSKGLDFHTHQSQAKIASTQQQIIYSKEEHMEVDTADAEAVADVGISEGVVAHPEDGVGIGFEITSSDVREDDEEFEAEMVASGERASLVERIRSLRLEYLKVRAILSIERDRIDSIRWHMALSQEEFRQVRRDRDDTRRRLGGWSRITMTITRSGMTPEAIEELINRRVEEALAAHEATRAANALEAENQSQNGSDDDNGNGDNRDGENRNGGNGNGGNGNPN